MNVKMRRILSSVPLWLAAAACAHGGGAGQHTDPAEVRAAIASVNAEFATALMHGDAHAVAALFTEDGEVIPATQKGFVSGRAEIEAYNARRIQARRYLDVVLTTVNVGVSRGGDLAWETGTNRVTTQEGDGPPVARSGRYLVVWRLEADGRWRIRADLPVPDPAP